MPFISHPLIRENLLESRIYQESILARAVEKNILCVLPTGLGKTPIAILLAVNRLDKYPESKILVMAPTKPLVTQHLQTFSKFLNLDSSLFQSITGSVKPENRETLYKQKQLIFSTPQTIQHDIVENRISLKGFSLLVLDEVHHAMGKYAYPFVAKKYLEDATNPKLLGLTASPGGTRGKIEEICSNVGMEAVEIRTEQDPDVVPYMKEKEIEWVNVELPDSFDTIRKYLQAAYHKRVDSLIRMGLARRKSVTKTELLALQAKLFSNVKKGNKWSFTAIGLVTQSIKIEHAIGLLETQGIPMLENYWKKIRQEEGKASKALLEDSSVSHAMFLTNNLFSDGFKHPKISKICSIVHSQLNGKPDSKIIVFASFRDSVSEITVVLNRIDGVKAVEFIGQGKRAVFAEKPKAANTGFVKASEADAIPDIKKQIHGLSQKEQIKRLQDFRDGEYNILVCTSIGEEGLDIPSMDMAIFYEPTASEIRNIQRRGRVGRQVVGKVIVLITKGTRDEAYYWSAHHKEKKMKGILFEMRGRNNL